MSKRILVVDDEKNVRELLQDILENAGYEVSTASSGAEALDLLRSHSFPVMFFDLMMPGMTGLDLCAAVRRSNPISLITAVTGLPSMFEVAACRAAGFDDYYTKPFDPADILRVAQDAFRKLERWNLIAKEVGHAKVSA